MGANRATETAGFYTDLPVRTEPLAEVLDDASAFAAVPPDWEIVITDVRGSTKAVAEGRLNEINLVATGCIIAALNLAHRRNIELPFFFGGDGATLLVPPGLAEPVAIALARHRDNTMAQFGLQLRVGRVPVADAYDVNASLGVARVDINGAGLVQPVALGSGFEFAERMVKGGDAPEVLTTSSGELDLTGMECRWSSIPPPQSTHEVLCLIVSSRVRERQGASLASVVRALEHRYGAFENRNPISKPNLHFALGFKKLENETRARLQRFDLRYFIEAWLRTQLSRPYFARNANGRYYIDRLVQLASTMTLDGRLCTVVSGTPEQRAALEAELLALEQAGDIVYGLHVCDESLMTCYVRDRRDQHLHFVDGVGGGYTQAAVALKRKLAATREGS